MKKIIFIASFFVVLVDPTRASEVLNRSMAPVTQELLTKLEREYSKDEEILALKKELEKKGRDSVEALIEVMKNAKYPIKNRWIATFMLGKIMGTDAAPFLAKFLEHPHWMMRLSALKSLLALNQKVFVQKYIEKLKDDSLIVRMQALENIRAMDLQEAGPHVWEMLYDKKNYYQTKDTVKRGNIIRSVVKTVGDLRFEKAKEVLSTMIQKEKYNDIFEEIDYSLNKITGKKSPDGDMKTKRTFWSRSELANKVI